MPWQNAGPDVMILNVDGSLLSDPPRASFGGLVRNHLSNFVLGFYGNHDAASILSAELHAIHTRLQLCWQAGFRRVISFSDSLLSVQLVQKGTSCNTTLVLRDNFKRK